MARLDRLISAKGLAQLAAVIGRQFAYELLQAVSHDFRTPLATIKASSSGLLDPDGKLPRIGRVFIADSIAAMGGALLGTSTVTSYIESAAGVKAGGRTGLTGVTVAALFLLTLFFAPLAGSVPSWATAPALLYVACLMMRGLAELEWDDVSEYAPAVVTALAMPLTFSIANGIAFGFITYAAVKLLSGRFAEAGPSMMALAALFVVKYAFF